MVTMARNCGNIWMISRNSRPGRRPLNRKRENAKAAKVESDSEKTVAKPARVIELMGQLVKFVRLKSASKLVVLAPVGMSELELSVPSGLNAALTTNTMGNR